MWEMLVIVGLVLFALYYFVWGPRRSAGATDTYTSNGDIDYAHSSMAAAAADDCHTDGDGDGDSDGGDCDGGDSGGDSD